MTNDRRRVTDEIQRLLDEFCIRDIVSAVDPYAGKFHDLCLALAKERGEELLRRVWNTIGSERLPALAACWAIATKKVETHVMLRLAITLGTSPEAEAGRPLLARPWTIAQPTDAEFWSAFPRSALGDVIRWLKQPDQHRLSHESLIQDTSIKPGVRVRMAVHESWESGGSMTELLEAALEDYDASPLVRRRELLRALSSPQVAGTDRRKLNDADIAELSLQGQRLLTRFPDLWHIACEADVDSWSARVRNAQQEAAYARHHQTIRKLCAAISHQQVTELRGAAGSRGAYGKLWKAVGTDPDLAKKLHANVKSAIAKMAQPYRSTAEWTHLPETEAAKLKELLPMLPIPAHWRRSHTSLTQSSLDDQLKVTPSLAAVAHRMPANVQSLVMRSKYRNTLPLSLLLWQTCSAADLRAALRTRPDRTQALLHLVARTKSLTAYAKLFLQDAEAPTKASSKGEWCRVLPEPDRRRILQWSLADAGLPRWARAMRLGLLGTVELSMLPRIGNRPDHLSRRQQWDRQIALIAPRLQRTADSVRTFFNDHCNSLRPLALSLTLAEWDEVTRAGELNPHSREAVLKLLPKLDTTVRALLRERLGARSPTTTPTTARRARADTMTTGGQPAKSPQPPRSTQGNQQATTEQSATPRHTPATHAPQRPLTTPTIRGPRPTGSNTPRAQLHRLLEDHSYDPAQLVLKLMENHALVNKTNVAFALARARKLPARTKAFFELLAAIGAEHAKALWTIFTWCRRGEGPGHRLDHAYHQHELPKKSGGTRTISAPHRTLRYLQTRIYEQILAPIPVHPAAHGFVPSRSILDNAAVHVGQPVVTNVDVSNCFPSVRWPLVLGALRRHLAERLSPMAISMLCDVCTAFGALPIGAPTSPTLLNLILLRTDETLTRAAERKSCRYTRYADDLTFSGDHGAVELLGVARRTLSQIGLKLDDKKTQIYRKGRRQMVTGLVVNQQVSIPRRLRRRLRATGHHAQQGKPTHWHSVDSTLTREQLQGLLSYLHMVHPGDAARLAARTARPPETQSGAPEMPDQAP